MENKINGFLLSGIILTISLLGCRNNLVSSDLPDFIISLNNIAFESQTTNDLDEIQPLEMYFGIDIKNTSDSPVYFGVYNNKFSEKEKEYGYFEMILGLDTVQLFSNYSTLYEIDKNQVLNLQMSYEGSLLQRFMISEKTDLDGVKYFLEKIKLRYIPVIDVGGCYIADFNSVIDDIQTNSFVIEYTIRGKTKIALSYNNNNWKELPID